MQLSKIDPTQPLPEYSKLAQNSMVNILNNTPLNLPGMPNDPTGLMSGIESMSQDVISQTEELLRERKERKKQLKKMRELRQKKLYEKRKKEKIKEVEREIADKEAENRRQYEELQRKKVEGIVGQNRIDFEEKLRRKREAEEEEKRKAQEALELAEKNIRDRENRIS